MKKVLLPVLLFISYNIFAQPSTDAQMKNVIDTAVTNKTAQKSITAPGLGSVLKSMVDFDSLKRTQQVSLTKLDSTLKKYFPNLAASYPNTDYNNEFLVLASGIIRPSCGSCVHGNTINWALLDNSSQGHGYTLIDTVYGSGSTVVVGYPLMKEVFSCIANPDESYVSWGVGAGGSVNLDKAAFTLVRYNSVTPRYKGNGTNTWVSEYDNGVITLGTFGQEVSRPGETGFAIIGSGFYSSDAITPLYIGKNNYRLVPTRVASSQFSQLFYLLDSVGNLITTNPTSNDVILFTGCNPRLNGFAASIVIGSGGTSNGGGLYSSGGFNWWVNGLFEAWMIGYGVSTTENTIKWQTDYPSATNYKLYRSTTKYGTRTLINTSTSGIFTDSGLTTNTLYFYHLVAVVGGVDTYVTYWKVKTKKS